MSANAPVKFTRGETLTISGEVRSVDGALFNITGATVSFRAKLSNGVTINKAGSVVSGPVGTYIVLLSPADQALMIDGNHRYEIRCTFTDGTVKSVNAGVLTVLPTLF